MTGWRHWSDAKLYILLQQGEERLSREVTSLGGGRYLIGGGDRSEPLEMTLARGEGRDQDGGYRVTSGGLTRRVDVARSASSVTVFALGRSFGFILPNALEGAEEAEAGGDVLIAPMPGLVSTP